jgi:hypothetical protein
MLFCILVALLSTTMLPFSTTTLLGVDTGSPCKQEANGKTGAAGKIGVLTNSS